MVVAVKIDSKRVQNMFTGYIRTIPEASDRGVFNLARFSGKVLKEEARKAGLKHWGGGKRQLFSAQTGARKVRKGQYLVVMPIHGRFLDSMRPHFVAFKRGRLITKWAKDKGLKGSGVIVHPHPFIAAGVTKTIRKAKSTVEKEVNKGIRRRGKR